MNKITGEKIYLVPINRSHTPLIVKWRNNPSVRNNFIFREEFTEQLHNAWLDTKVASGEVVQFVIYDVKDKPVGSVYLRDIDSINKKAEFGIFIGEDDERGKGYGSEATRLICSYGFERLSLHKIMLRVFAFNSSASRSYERCGFEREAYLRDEVYIDGKYEDIILMALFNK